MSDEPSKVSNLMSWEGIGTETGLSVDDPIQVLTAEEPYHYTQDKRGHSTFLGGRFPKDFPRGIEKIREKAAGVYETNSDVVRDAIYLGMKILSLRYEVDPQWQVQHQIIKLNNEIAWQATVYRQEEDFVNNLVIFINQGDDEIAQTRLQERYELLQNTGQTKRILILDEIVKRLKLTRVRLKKSKEATES